MARVAWEKGFKSLGFSEHGRQAFDLKYCLDDARREQYVAEVKRLRDQYAGRMKIWLGIERDLYSTERRADYDYVIGSVHYLMRDGDYTAVDGDPVQLKACLQGWYAGDGLALATDYFERLADYVCEYRPDIVGHFDLVRKWNRDGSLFDQNHARYRCAAGQALERMASVGALLEINTGAMARGYQDTPYPERWQLECWRAQGGGIIISSDCHLAQQLDYGFDEAKALARSAGYRSVYALGTGAERFVQIEIS